MLESILGYFGLGKAGAVGAAGGAVLVFLRKRDGAAAWLALSGALFALLTTRSAIRWFKLGPELEIVVAMALASAGIVLAHRLLHLFELIDWETLLKLWRR